MPIGRDPVFPLAHCRPGREKGPSHLSSRPMEPAEVCEEEQQHRKNHDVAFSRYGKFELRNTDAGNLDVAGLDFVKAISMEGTQHKCLFKYKGCTGLYFSLADFLLLEK